MNQKIQKKRGGLNDGDNVVNFYLDGKLVFSGDWDGNFKQLFKCLLKEVK